MLLLCVSCGGVFSDRQVILGKARNLHGRLSEERRKRKTAAVAFMGGSCFGCGIKGPLTLFEFHHRDARDKSFGISQDGIMRSWDMVVAELAKCVMLCANCHREVHAGVRTAEPKIGEAASAYAA